MYQGRKRLQKLLFCRHSSDTIVHLFRVQRYLKFGIHLVIFTVCTLSQSVIYKISSLQTMSVWVNTSPFLQLLFSFWLQTLVQMSLARNHTITSGRLVIPADDILSWGYGLLMVSCIYWICVLNKSYKCYYLNKELVWNFYNYTLHFSFGLEAFVQRSYIIIQLNHRNCAVIGR